MADFFWSEAQSDEEIARAEARLAKLERMEKNVQRPMIEGEIPLENFKEHQAQIESERARLKSTVDVIKGQRELVKADFEIALDLARQFDFLFDKGNYDERRLLCETVFKR